MVKVAAAFCLCPNDAVITSPSKSNCLVLESKKVLNYTHPWRHVINFAADFLAIVLYNKCVYVGNLLETVGLQWVPGPYSQEQCCQRQHIDHHILKRGPLHHPPRGGKVRYRFSAFWLRSSVVSVLISLISDTLLIEQLIY